MGDGDAPVGADRHAVAALRMAADRLAGGAFPPGSRTVRAPMLTAPSRIRALRGLRDSGGAWFARAWVLKVWASTRSSRWPAWSPATLIVCLLACGMFPESLFGFSRHRPRRRAIQ